jgi:hypothetical protein
MHASHQGFGAIGAALDAGLSQPDGLREKGLAIKRSALHNGSAETQNADKVNRDMRRVVMP